MFVILTRYFYEENHIINKIDHIKGSSSQKIRLNWLLSL
jgi:hypothetical protein